MESDFRAGGPPNQTPVPCPSLFRRTSRVGSRPRNPITPKPVLEMDVVDLLRIPNLPPIVVIHPTLIVVAVYHLTFPSLPLLSTVTVTFSPEPHNPPPTTHHVLQLPNPRPPILHQRNDRHRNRRPRLPLALPIPPLPPPQTSPETAKPPTTADHRRRDPSLGRPGQIRRHATL